MLKVKEKVTSFWQNHNLEKFHPYEWETHNNMKYKGDKLINLRIGPINSVIKENTIQITLGYVEPIEEVEVAKNLGIMFDADLEFKVQRNKAITNLHPAR